MNCVNEVLLNKIGVNKLNKQSELAFTVMKNLPDCRKIDTKKYVDIIDDEGQSVEATPSYNQFKIPQNVFECMREGCINTGTLYPDTQTGNVVYKAAFDAVEFAAGVVTFYATNATSVEVKISSTADFANADKYVITPGTAGADGFAPIVVDLSSTPTETIGNGWVASRDGAYIAIKAIGTDAGISSIAIFDSLNDFETSDVVTVGCLTEVSGDYEIDAAEATCWSSGYATDDLSFERTITGNKVSPNYWQLNPLIGKGKATIGFERTTATKTIEANGDYGTVSLPDMYQDECGNLAVQLADNCNVTDSQLTRLSIPTMINVDEGHYFVINDGDTTTLYFNKALVGSEVIVSYPKTADIEEEIGDAENIGSVRVRMTETIEQTDGTKIVFVYDNVLITSFPHTINEEETEFSFTINIQKDASGHYFRKYRILS